MKKMIFTLVLAIASSVWMTSEALCFYSPNDNGLGDLGWFRGTVELVPGPCEEGEVCPPCLSPALMIDNVPFYLVTLGSARIEAQIEALEPYFPLEATICGMMRSHYIILDQFYPGTMQFMFPPDTRWHYVLNILTGEPEPIIKYYSIEPIDTLINNTRYQKIQNALFRSSGAKVWCALDSVGTLVERLVYDFDLQVGDSISITVGNENGIWLVPEEDPTYAKVTNVEYIKLADGRMARRISYDYRSDDIEHIGSVKGILAPLSYPGHPDSWSSLLCCTRSDFLLYEAESGACDTFLVNVQHTDTIPLYARDDSGSSTVDPVDPNQIYATLTGDKLTVHNNTGAQVTFTLNNTSVNNIAARVRANTEPVSFTESISVELTEDGLYEIWLTSEEWNYSIFGTINYVRSATTITKEDPASTTKKVLRGTHILIEREGKTYTLTGQEIN